MCVKLPSRDINSGPCPPHLTSSYTCKVTNAPRVCSGKWDLKQRECRKFKKEDKMSEIEK